MTGDDVPDAVSRATKFPHGHLLQLSAAGTLAFRHGGRPTKRGRSPEAATPQRMPALRARRCRCCSRSCRAAADPCACRWVVWNIVRGAETARSDFAPAGPQEGLGRGCGGGAGEFQETAEAARVRRTPMSLMSASSPSAGMRAPTSPPGRRAFLRKVPAVVAPPRRLAIPPEIVIKGDVDCTVDRFLRQASGGAAGRETPTPGVC